MVLTDNELIIPFIIYYAIVIIFTWFFISRGINWFFAFTGGLVVSLIIMTLWFGLAGGVTITDKSNSFVRFSSEWLFLSPYFVAGTFLGLIVYYAYIRRDIIPII